MNGYGSNRSAADDHGWETTRNHASVSGGIAHASRRHAPDEYRGRTHNDYVGRPDTEKKIGYSRCRQSADQNGWHARREDWASYVGHQDIDHRANMQVGYSCGKRHLDPSALLWPDRRNIIG
jgi:hypothetical protein